MKGNVYFDDPTLYGCCENPSVFKGLCFACGAVHSVPEALLLVRASLAKLIEPDNMVILEALIGALQAIAKKAEQDADTYELGEEGAE